VLDGHASVERVHHHHDGRRPSRRGQATDSERHHLNARRSGSFSARLI
jgi:hypothetical protein